MPKRMIAAIGLAIAMQAVIIAQEAPMTPLRPDQVAFLALYKELVETNTTLSAGSCTLGGRAGCGAPEGGGLCRPGYNVVFCARSSQGGRVGRHPRGNFEDCEADVAARPSRRSRG